jgi:N6-L-threonylcarbamoyladenine synthase
VVLPQIKKLKKYLKIWVKKVIMMFFFPSLYLCTDNAAMIAYAGLERLRRKKINSLKFAPKPRWPLDKDAAFLKGKRIDAK